MWRAIGRAMFWLTLPGIALIVWRSQRSRLLVVCDDHILAVRMWLGSGDWFLPGGGIGRSETAAQAVVREAAEEVGLQLTAEQLEPIGVAPFKRWLLSYTNHFFRISMAQRPALTIPHRLEISEYAWLPIMALPPGCSPEITTALKLARLLG